MAIALQKEDCCGCGSCRQACPMHCIELCADAEGFCFPRVDLQKCVGCEKCVRVCPALNLREERKPLSVTAAKNGAPEDWAESSSGGVFPALAQKIISEGGIVFGACFDTVWNVIHAGADSSDGIRKFYSSKYVQSDTGHSFIEAQKLLNEGRTVLFSGTPCQIAALKSFLGKDYETLFTVDVICHGVPSPLIWQKYLKESFGGASRITDIQFRSKRFGWQDYCIKIRYRRAVCGLRAAGVSALPNDENPFMRGFLNNLTLRPSCYQCKYRCGRSGSDITLGDCWGIRQIAPEFYSPRGVSQVLCGTAKGEALLRRCDLVSVEIPYAEAVKYNSALEQSPAEPPERALFWKNPDENIPLSAMLRRALRTSRKKTVSVWLKNRAKRILRLFAVKS